MIPELCPQCSAVRSFIQDNQVGYSCGALYRVSRAEEEDTMVTAIGCKIGLPPVSAPTPPPKSEVHTKVIGGVTVEVRSFPLTLTFSHKGESVVFEGDDVGKVLAWAKEEGFKL